MGNKHSEHAFEFHNPAAALAAQGGYPNSHDFSSPRARGHLGGSSVASPDNGYQEVDGEPFASPRRAPDNGYQEVDGAPSPRRRAATLGARIPSMRTTDDDRSGYLAVDPAWLSDQNRLMAMEPWFRGRYPREKAIQEIQNAPIGTFLIRISSRPGHYAITCKMGNSTVENLLIIPSWDHTGQAAGQTQYRIGSATTKKFNSVKGLIEYYCRVPYFKDEFGNSHTFRFPRPPREALQQHRGGYIQVSPSRRRTQSQSQSQRRPTRQECLQQGSLRQQRLQSQRRRVSDPTGQLPSYNQAARRVSAAKERHAMDKAGEAALELQPPRVELPRQEPVTPTAFPASQDATNKLEVEEDEILLIDQLNLSEDDLDAYEEYWLLAVAQDENTLGPQSAVQFFSKSDLDLGTLGGIWNLADTKGRGELRKGEFFLALKLVALAQGKIPLKMENIGLGVPLPKF